jgi:HlyD family secretion protein
VVEQVRLQSKLTDNVVSYTVVVTLDNAGSQLLPGMTATVQFITGSATNVLTVPNAALRFTPTSEERAASGLPLTTPSADSSRGGRGGGAGGRGTGAVASAAGATADTPVAGITAAVRPRRAGGSAAGGPGSTGGPGGLWTLDANQKLARLPVRVALSDGQRTQVSGVGIVAGTQVIIGALLATSSQAAPSANPLAPAQGGGRRGGG